jgi:hypothetical protein
MPSTFAVEKTLMVSEISVSYGEPAKRFSRSDEKMVPHTRQVSNDRLLLMGALTVARYRRVSDAPRRCTCRSAAYPMRFTQHVQNELALTRTRGARPN